MGKYLVTYDLVGTDETSEDYRRLINRLGYFPNHIKLQKSVWAIESAFDTEKISTELMEYMDYDDRLFVVALPRGAAYHRPICGGAAYREFMNS
jgi:hypothetical protein